MKKILEKIVATFKANYNKAAYWAQLVGSVLIVGLAIGTVFFKLQIDSSAALMIITGIGAVLSLWGTITDNSILEDTGDTIKTKANVLASTEQSVVAALTEAQKKLRQRKHRYRRQHRRQLLMLIVLRQVLRLMAILMPQVLLPL